uniref:G protein-coupled receptor 156 n=1 Tax=Takifugu rubripes TaxID=31033 RepID=H2RXG9_TAKRU
ICCQLQMSQITLSEELLLCPICLDLFNLPISTPCGHNFCKECIQGYWEIAELPQCPVCKQKLSKGPEFKVNTLLSELATQFKKSSEDFSSINDRLHWINEINQTAGISRENAAREIQDCLQLFQKLFHMVQKGQEDLLEDINSKQMQVELKARGMVVALEQEIDTFVQKRASDHHHFQVLSTSTRACLQPAVYVGAMSRAVTRVAGELEETVGVHVKRLYETEIQRARQYAVDVTLDPDTAHPKLILSENRKQVHHGDVALKLPDNPKRFYPGVSVLGNEGFSSERFYYEVLVKGKTEWDIGVGLENVSRKGGNMLNPENGYWALGMRGGQSYWALSSTPVSLPLVKELQRVGIYVDMECGQVSFYNVDVASLIYTFTGYSFSQRLFPYFNPRRNQNGTNSAPLIILPVDV